MNDAPLFAAGIQWTPITRRLHRYTYSDFVALDQDSSTKHEFFDEAYRTIPTLRDYIIVSHRERRITVYSRNGDDEWTARVAITAGRVTVDSVGAELAVDEIYRASSMR